MLPNESWIDKIRNVISELEEEDVCTITIQTESWKTIEIQPNSADFEGCPGIGFTENDEFFDVLISDSPTIGLCPDYLPEA